MYRQIFFAVSDSINGAAPVALESGFIYEWQAKQWLIDHIKAIGLSGYFISEVLKSESTESCGFMVREHTFTWDHYSN